MEFIPLREVLIEMRGGLPFTIKYVTLDKKRKTGGEFKRIEASMLKSESITALKGLDTNRQKKAGAKSENKPFPKLISVWVAAKRRYTDIHVRLIKEFNGKIITY